MDYTSDNKCLTFSSRSYGVLGLEEPLGKRTLSLDTDVVPWPQHYWYRNEAVPHGRPQVLVDGICQSTTAELQMLVLTLMKKSTYTKRTCHEVKKCRFKKLFTLTLGPFVRNANLSKFHVTSIITHMALLCTPSQLN